MAIEKKTDQQQSQEGGGQQSSQQSQDQQQQQKTDQLPEQLSKLGFKSIGEIVEMATRFGEAVEDSAKAKTMLKELTKTKQEPQKDALDEITEDSFMQDPRGASIKTTQAILNKHFQERVAPLADELVESNLEFQKMRIQSDPEDGPILKMFESEVDDFLKGLPPAMKVKKNCVSTALEYVVGKNRKKLREHYIAGIPKGVAGAGSAGGSSEGGGNGESGSLKFNSTDEREAAEKQVRAGMFKSLAEYVEWRDK
jgi:hypothetical protein